MFREFVDESIEVQEATSYLEIFNYVVRTDTMMASSLHRKPTES